MKSSKLIKKRHWTKGDLQKNPGSQTNVKRLPPIILSKDSEPLEFSDDTCTVQDNRIDKCPIEDSAIMKKKPRGTFDSFDDRENNIVCVEWRDNSVVTVLSNKYGIAPVRKAARIGFRGKKWYIPILFWTFDVCMNNAWILSRHLGKQMDNLEFSRVAAISVLQKYGKPPLATAPCTNFVSPTSRRQEQHLLNTGCCFYMSLIQLPACIDYWSSALGHPIVSDVMGVNRFVKIKNILNFNNNATFVEKSQVGHDKLHKVRPLIDKLRERLSLVRKEEQLCIDEQIVFFKDNTTPKSLTNGDTSDNVCIEPEPDLENSSNVVAPLSRLVPRHKNYKLYFDNWYTSISLQVYLAKESILSLGAVRSNRLSRCKLPSEKKLKKRGRGLRD
ncbi:hypothetical protein ILUMI_26945 [Ignelater luminosus]|uniref:PiggyBac transposable element-derived protein domain-containing protein n=1 Tax=Ignelater luminosus TaxID=2038154 RepID=A0A8K0FYN6_IGNLU|nr:hypothetical protein ILUMI_26945 [Ignelater luminosus]